MRSRRGSDLRRQLADLVPSLRPVAEDVLTNASRIDVVALDDEGSVVAVFDAEGDDLATFTRALAATAWLEDHLPDWCQIAPDLGMDASAPVRALLVATAFETETRAAARLVGSQPVVLLEAGSPGRPVRNSATPPGRPGSARPPSAPPLSQRDATVPRSRHSFRTGLTDADLGVGEASPVAEKSPRDTG